MHPPVYIAEIRITPRIEDKIRAKHKVMPYEVREALVLRDDVYARWEDHREHGLRVVALGRTYVGRPILAALHLVSTRDGTWNLATARSPK